MALNWELKLFEITLCTCEDPAPLQNSRWVEGSKTENRRPNCFDDVGPREPQTVCSGEGHDGTRASGSSRRSSQAVATKDETETRRTRDAKSYQKSYRKGRREAISRQRSRFHQQHVNQINDVSLCLKCRCAAYDFRELARAKLAPFSPSPSADHAAPPEGKRIVLEQKV